MDFIFDFVIPFFFEASIETAMESKRLKPWVKTAIMFFVINLITAVLLFVAYAAHKNHDGNSDGKIVLVLAVISFVVSIVACISGHKRGWQSERTCPLPKPAAPVHRNEPNPNMTIRTAFLTDLDAIAAVEAECFPPAEAATRAEFAERLRHYADHFWLMFDGDKLISFVDGFVTNEEDLTDEMYANAAMHNAAGAWQMIFGVNTIPAYRNHGYAAQLIEQAILDAREQGRKGVVLTCKPEKVAYYLKFGFQNEGISKNSTHGGAVWHQMRLTF